MSKTAAKYLKVVRIETEMITARHISVDLEPVQPFSDSQ